MSGGILKQVFQAMNLAKIDGDAVIFDPTLSAASQIHIVSIQASTLDLGSKARCLF
tara:strand:- start:256 stop:423 length:168 start_codon:yes stop_codon:yes gene_type:complete